MAGRMSFGRILRGLRRRGGSGGKPFSHSCGVDTPKSFRKAKAPARLAVFRNGCRDSPSGRCRAGHRFAVVVSTFFRKGFGVKSRPGLGGEKRKRTRVPCRSPSERAGESAKNVFGRQAGPSALAAVRTALRGAVPFVWDFFGLHSDLRMTAPQLYAVRAQAVRAALGTDVLAQWRIDRLEADPNQAFDADGNAVLAPVDPVALLAVRRELVQRLLLASADRELFEAHFLPALLSRAAFVQDLPDPRDPAFAGRGGLFALGLETALCALRRLDARVFGLDRDPPARRQLRERWKVFVFLSALSSDGGRLAEMTVRAGDKVWLQDEPLLDFALDSVPEADTSVASAASDRFPGRSSERSSERRMRGRKEGRGREALCPPAAETPLFVLLRSLPRPGGGSLLSSSSFGWVPRATRRWLADDPFFARLLSSWERGGIGDESARWVVKLVNDAVFEVLRKAPVPADPRDRFARIRSALGHWVEAAMLEAAREGVWLFVGPESNGPLVHGVEGVFLLWPEGPSKLLREGFRSVPGMPEPGEGLPEDLNDWLQLLTRHGTFVERGDGNPVFLIHVPRGQNRRAGGVEESAAGKVEEAVLLRDGERFLEAARLRAMERGERFFGDPLGSLLHPARHAEEIEGIREEARVVLPGRFAWRLSDAVMEPAALREALTGVLDALNQTDPMRSAAPHGVFLPLGLLRRPSKSLLLRWLTAGGWLLENRPGQLFWRRETARGYSGPTGKRKADYAAVSATANGATDWQTDSDVHSEEGVLLTARAVRSVTVYADGREEDAAWPPPGPGLGLPVRRAQRPVVAAEKKERRNEAAERRGGRSNATAPQQIRRR